MNLKTMSDMCKFTASVLTFFDDACSVPHFQQHFVIILFKHILMKINLSFVQKNKLYESYSLLYLTH